MLRAHFENYDKMYSTGTWIFPILRSLVPPEGIILPICPDYAEIYLNQVIMGTTSTSMCQWISHATGHSL
jgi:hypothetical protein